MSDFGSCRAVHPEYIYKTSPRDLRIRDKFACLDLTLAIDDEIEFSFSQWVPSLGARLLKSIFPIENSPKDVEGDEFRHVTEFYTAVHQEVGAKLQSKCNGETMWQ